MMSQMEKMFSSIKQQWLRILIGGSIIACLVFFFPPLYGEGYSVINYLLEGNVGKVVEGTVFYVDRDNVWFLALYIGAIALMKAIATSSTNGAGGVGGTFAPSLFVGALTGFLFAFILNNIYPELGLSVKNFTLMGMAGVMAGVMHAPLMAIFLTAEMTGGYNLFLPLLIVSALSYLVIQFFTPYSIYAVRLAKQGDLMTHQKDKAVLTLMKVDNLIETDFKVVHPEMSLKEMVDVISVSNRNLFPVTDSEGYLKGVVLLDDIRNIMFRTDLYRKMHVSRFMSAVPDSIEIDQPMDRVMEIFDRTNAWNLPVVENGKYVGFVSKSKIFNSYRKVLKHFTDD
jgi:CIC family chloride channel protein